jgi:N-acetyl-anhydromuramoyl-L-alanine amidase
MEIAHQLLTGARFVASENFDDRPNHDISLIVIHCISLPAGHYGNDCVERLFCNRLDGTGHTDLPSLEGTRVSSHLFIRRDGSIVQFVPFDRRAWHAGASNFQYRQNCNDFSIGIELEGTDWNRYRDVQYDVLIDICGVLVRTFGIPTENIVGHSDIAPGRKTDPGGRFDWQRLRCGVQAITTSTSEGMA